MFMRQCFLLTGLYLTAWRRLPNEARQNPALEEELEREIREAQAGVRCYITRRAAAW